MKKIELAEAIAKNRIHYDSIGRVWCKILNSHVHFTSEGRIHLLYKGNRKKRTTAEQWYKIKLFPLVIPVLKNAVSVEDWRLPNKDNQPSLKQPVQDVQYYSISCTVGNKDPVDIRVVIKRTGDGQFNYHSVMKNKKKPCTKKSHKM